MASVEIRDLLNYLQRLEDGWFSDLHMKDVIQRLKLKIQILISKWEIEHEISVLENAIDEYQKNGMDSIDLSGDGVWRSSLTAAKLALPNLEKLRFIKPEMEEMYSAVFKSSRSIALENDKDVVSFVSLLYGNLKDILSSKSGILVPVRPQILALQEELKFLRNFLCFISQICIEHHFSQDLYTFAEAVAVNAAYLLHFLRAEKKMSRDMEYGIKLELLDLVDKLKALQQPDVGEIYLRALEGASLKLLDLEVIDYECVLRFFDSLIDNLRELSHKIYLQSASKDQIEILHEELSSLRFYLMDMPLHDSNEKLDNFMFKIQELSIHTGCFIYSSIRKKDQFTLLASDEKLGGLVEKIEHVKSESNYFFIPRSWQSNFPMTNELGYVDFIIKNLEERLHSMSAPTDPLVNQINTVYEGLVELRNDFGRTSKLQNEIEELEALFTRYKDIAYRAEYFVDSSLCGVVSFWCQRMGLVNLAEELSHIRKELKAISNDIIDLDIGTGPNFISSHANSLSIDAVVDSEDNVKSIKDKADDQLVGFEDEATNIREQILGGFDQLTILSIIGMPGLGKTTLAKSVYSDPSVTMRFHTRAWCSVSQVYSKDNLLLQILLQVQPKTKEELEKEGKSFDHKLYQSLKGMRYLVVLDDIWDIEAWNHLRPSFPNDNNRSRIIFTTRNQSVVKQAYSVPQALRLLSDEESWKLLQVRIFKEETCPAELLQVGRKIAENCKGLPLTVVLTAGLLKLTERKQDSWEHVANVMVDYRREGHLGILELSYKHLPDYLKPCFLYFGAFPEDAEIPIWKLVRLWIAEGFVQPKVPVSSLELEAEKYLNDLIDRSLLMIAKRSYDGGVKSCHIHDLLRDFCTDRAREESFLLKMNKYDSLPTDLTDAEVHEQYRLCIHSNTEKIPPVRMGHFESRVRSLWFSMSGDSNHNSDSTRIALRGMPSTRLFSPPSCSRFRYYNKLRGIEVFFKFRLLRVLDLGTLDVIAEESFDIITQLVHLRYLSILAYARRIPAEIENLKNLETFLLKGTRLGHVALPETIWNMVNLRYIQIKEGATVSFLSEVFENCSKLDGLTSISTLVLHTDKTLEKMMRKLSNLKKLKCEMLPPLNDEHRIPSAVVDFLDQLEELSISNSHPHVIFPSSLKKLTLSDTILYWDQVSVIGELPNLEVLKLIQAATGDEWHMNEGEFQKLKFLMLERSPIRIWNASSEHLPSLEQLVLKDCEHLEEIPFDFWEIPFLRLIEVSFCNPSVVDSARNIQQEQCEMGNDQLSLNISGALRDF